jgi:hypothetical protein
MHEYIHTKVLNIREVAEYFTDSNRGGIWLRRDIGVDTSVPSPVDKSLWTAVPPVESRPDGESEFSRITKERKQRKEAG